MNYKSTIIIFGLSLLFSQLVFAHGEDDPLLTMFKVEQFEQQFDDDEETVSLHANAWTGYDLNKFWIKVDAEYAQSEFHELEAQALYSRAVHAFWDLQAGIRSDLKPEPERNWAVFGLQGLAPYFFEMNAVLFVSEDGDSAVRLEAEYELMLTQRWVLSPEIEMNFYGQHNAEYAQGSGLADVEAGLRLRYEIRRELAPYIGLVSGKRFGQTRDYALAAGESTEETRALVGISFWF